jgi:hypothetical protein
MKNLLTLCIGMFFLMLVASCSTTVPVAATNNPIGSKKGTSKTIMLGGAFISGTTILNNANLSQGWVLNKNFGVVEAAKKAKCENIATVDIKMTNYVIFLKAQVIVTGN